MSANFQGPASASSVGEDGDLAQILSTSEPGIQFANTDYDFVSLSLRTNSTNSVHRKSHSETNQSPSQSVSEPTISPDQALDMSDLVDNELNSQALALCKRYVLQHYFRLLQVVAWEPFASCSCCCLNNRSAFKYGSDVSFWQSIYVGTINIAYPILVISFLIYSYVFDVIGCQWVVTIAPFSPISPAIPNSNTTDTPSIFEFKNASTTTQVPIVPVFTRESCGAHWVTTYIVPSILHFTAYIMGFIYFRLMRSEQLYALIERVFLNSALVKNRTVMSLSRVIRKLRIILAYGFTWVVLATALYAFFLTAFPDHSYQIMHDALRLDDGLYYFMLALRSIGYTLANLVTLTVVFNFVVQCEMLCFYFEFIFHRLREKVWSINDAMKHVFTVAGLARSINLFQSHLTSVVMFKLLLTTVIGLISLFKNTQDTPMVWSYKIIFPIIWFVPVVYCFAEAARLFTYNRTLINQALEMRVFGYSATTHQEIDSFIQFLKAANIRTKLFHVGIRPSYLLMTAFVFSFTLVIMLQLDMIQFGSLKL